MKHYECDHARRPSDDPYPGGGAAEWGVGGQLRDKERQDGEGDEDEYAENGDDGPLRRCLRRTGDESGSQRGGKCSEIYQQDKRSGIARE